MGGCVKVVKFTPDATIRAAEQGQYIQDTVCVAFLGEIPSRNLVLPFIGITREYWEIVIQILKEHPTEMGKAWAEAIENAFREAGIR